MFFTIEHKAQILKLAVPLNAVYSTYSSQNDLQKYCMIKDMCPFKKLVVNLLLFLLCIIQILIIDLFNKLL